MPQSDLIKRFTETPFEAMLSLSGTSIRVETNCRAVIDQLGCALAPCPAGPLAVPDFVLRVVAESDQDFDPGLTSCIHRLSRNGLSFISLGQKSFLACDRQARQAISFVSENLVTDEGRFSQYFLPALVSLLKDSIETTS